MSVTIDQVSAQLNLDEPDYGKLALLGAEIVPFLKQLTLGTDAMLASKAVYLASLIQSEQSPSVVAAGISSPEVLVRVAAASAARNLPKALSINLFDSLLDDRDVGVRKVALNSISASGLLNEQNDAVRAILTDEAAMTEMSNLKTKIQGLATADQHEFIRELATETLR
ncbi:MAG: hypothetical protein HY785_22865 [Oscillatoriophycideae cyanobacterium NC_groundwater_1537_Pr4_S-0.65um_50_18]|nr:hypothetical protein [Oscillatoriophycideae cyanobacterium NC_groundwater_1537_Pr4_S-0.65um_50_18]